MEEMALNVEVASTLHHDHYQQSAFNPAHQIISIYYFVKALEPITAPLRAFPFDFDENNWRHMPKWVRQKHSA